MLLTDCAASGKIRHFCDAALFTQKTLSPSPQTTANTLLRILDPLTRITACISINTLSLVTAFCEIGVIEMYKK